MFQPEEKSRPLEKIGYWLLIALALGLGFWAYKGLMRGSASNPSANSATPASAGKPEPSPTQSGVTSVPAFTGTPADAAKSGSPEPEDVPPPPKN